MYVGLLYSFSDECNGVAQHCVPQPPEASLSANGTSLHVDGLPAQEQVPFPFWCVSCQCWFLGVCSVCLRVGVCMCVCVCEHACGGVSRCVCVSMHVGV